MIEIDPNPLVDIVRGVAKEDNYEVKTKITDQGLEVHVCTPFEPIGSTNRNLTVGCVYTTYDLRSVDVVSIRPGSDGLMRRVAEGIDEGLQDSDVVYQSAVKTLPK